MEEEEVESNTSRRQKCYCFATDFNVADCLHRRRSNETTEKIYNTLNHAIEKWKLLAIFNGQQATRP